MPKLDGLSPEEAELLVLQSAVSKADEIKGLRLVGNPKVQEMLAIVERFIQRKRLVLYGGTAINLLLPKADQFYDERKEIPDLDFWSSDALADSRELADIYAKAGFDVEGKSSVHQGTFKTRANGIAVADITQMPPTLFKNVQKLAVPVKINKFTVLVAPPDMLRMSMYLELSRPQGDTSRYEKVMKRLTVFNKHYPIETPSKKACHKRGANQDVFTSDQYDAVVGKLIDSKVVFFGAFAAQKYFKTDRSKFKGTEELPFDLLSNNAEHDADTVQKFVQKMLNDKRKVTVTFHSAVSETLPVNYEVKVGATTVALFYKPSACHNYNVVPFRGKRLKIATIDTMFSFYFSFVFANKPYLDTDRIRCIAHHLFVLQSKHRASKKGIFRRFNLSCIGRQQTMEGIILKKAQMFEKLKDDKNSVEYQKWFYKYEPNAAKTKTKLAKQVTEEENSIENQRSYLVTRKSQKGDKRRKRSTAKRRKIRTNRRAPKRKNARKTRRRWFNF